MLLIFITLVYISIYLLIARLAYNKQVFNWLDITAPVLSLLCWGVFAAVGYGAQSLANLIEIPIMLLLLLAIYVMRVAITLFSVTLPLSKYWLLIVGFTIVALLRSFVPVIPE